MPRPLQGMVLVRLPEWAGQERSACLIADWKTSLRPQRGGWVQEIRHHECLTDSQRNELYMEMCMDKDHSRELKRENAITGWLKPREELSTRCFRNGLSESLIRADTTET